MPSQLQQHRDNKVRDDINVVTNSITENTMNNVKNIHNNRQISYDPQNKQPFNESYSKRKYDNEDLLIVKVDNVKINNQSDEKDNYKNKSNTIDNHNQSRRKSSVLDISSLLCPNLSGYNSPSSSVDEDSTMDDVSSHLGDTESLGSPRSHKNSSTPATTPPYSPSGGSATNTITNGQEKRLFNGNNDSAFMSTHSQHDLQTQSNNHNSQNQLHYHNHQENDRYVEQGSSQEETIWKRPRLVLPPIRSLDPRSDSNNDYNNENLNGQFVYNQSSSPDRGKINSSIDHHSSQKSWNHLEQFAAITEAYRENSSNLSHTTMMDNASPSTIRLPPASSLTSHNRSFENDHRNLQIQNAVTNNTTLNPLRKSSFDVTQTRFNPYTPSTLSPYTPSSRFLDQRRHADLPDFNVNSPRNDHISPESSYLHYGYDRSDANRHYMPRHYGGMHSPPSPNTYPHHGYSMPSHGSYPTPPSSHHHIQLSHHHHHHHLGSPYMDPTNSGAMVKAKRKRANASQLKVLNQIFQHTFFPSTELRIQLGKQLGMSPRTVQIWFQNKRQSWRSKSRATTNSPMKDDDDCVDDSLEVEGNVNNNNNGSVNETLISRRASNSSLSCSDDDETGRRSIPDSPLDNTYSRSDYFTSGARSNNNGNNEGAKMTSSGNTSPTNSYFAQPQHSSNNNNNYYNHHRSNSGSGNSVMQQNNTGVMTPTSPPSSLTNQLPPSPVYSTSSNSERLPTFASSFAHTSSYHNTVSNNNNSNHYDPFPSNRLPTINHCSPQAQSSFGYQASGI